MTDKDFKEIQAKIPRQPGVYRFLDSEDVILYVGKAKSLRNRLTSYFGSTKNKAYKTRKMVQHASRIEFTIVETEADALLLENTLIKKFQPRYNVLMKDGKNYTYIVVKKEPFPRVFFTRKMIRDGSTYFGPYTSKYRVNIILDIIKKLFQLRTCFLPLSQKNIEADKFKVCLEYHIKNCAGPCVGFEEEAVYDQKIQQIRNILNGNFAPVKAHIREQMQKHSMNMEFELAQSYKEKLTAFEDYQAKSTVVSTSLGNLDVFAYEEDEKTAFVNYLKIINGVLINTDTVELTKNMDEEKEDIMLFAIEKIREKFNSFSQEIIVPFDLGWLIENVKISVPLRGEKKKLLDLAMKNVKYYQMQLRKEAMNKAKKVTSSERILKTMQEDLQMDVVPFHIECFDNSNIQGTNPVSSCVVFKNAKPSKKDYRKFNIKTVVGPDDFASMKEVVYRRYKRLKEENEDLPQLVIIDGGKGQLSAAYEILKDLGLEHKIQMIGIAKRLEEIFFPEDPIPLYINKKSETLKVIQHARNEAHRFAITFHRDQRSRNALGTELTNIPGVGEKTANKLLIFYGSVSKIKLQTISALATVIGLAAAKKVHAYFNSSEEE